MKRLLRLLFYCLSLLFVAGCGGNQGGSGEGTSPEMEANLPEELASSPEFDLWELVAGEYGDGVFRGVSFGDTRQKVEITETFEVFEELPDQVLYTHDTRELETVDIYYHFSEEQLVSKIVVDIFLNGTSSTERLWEIAGWYFGRQYGEDTDSGETKKVWVHSGTKTVLENVSKGIDYGVKITFTPSDREALAELRP